MAPTITAFEHGRLDLSGVPGDASVLTRLLSVSAGGRAAFVARRGAVYARDLVGAVDLGSLRVEILPKPYGIYSVAEARTLLTGMLRIAGNGFRPGWLDGGSDEHRTDILDLVQRRAASELLQRLEVGVPRRYHEVEEVATTLRGRIRFSGLARRMPSDAHRVPVRYSPLAHDNPLGRLLKALCITLRNRAVSQAARRDLDLCIDLLGGVRTEPLTTQLVRRVALGRFETEWRPLIELAALIAQGMSPDPANLGGTRQDTLLFPLERLFELVIRRSLTERLMPPLTCAASPGEHGLLSLTTPAGRETALALRPDLLFRRSESVVAAGDAKWKRLEQCPPRFTILPADVYQILAYMRLFSVRTGLLFFPRASWMPEDWTCQFTVAPDEAERITVLAVDLARLADPLPDRRAAHADALARRVQAALETEPDAAVEELRPPAPLHA